MKQEQLPVWDLSALYKSIDDPKIQSDAKKNFADARNFAKKFHGKVSKLTNKEILAAFRQIEKIMLTTVKLLDFAELNLSVDSRNPKIGVLKQQMTDHYFMVNSELLFFDLELMELSEARIKQLMVEKSLSNYKHHISLALKYKPHHLSETEEKIFNDKSATGPSAFIRLFEQHLSHKQFDLKIGKTSRIASETELLDLMTSTDRTTRKAAAEAFTTGLRQDEDMLGLIYNTVVKDKAINDKWHKFQTPEEARHMANEIDQKTVDAMAEAIELNYGVVADFYNFKKEAMGLPKLYSYDRYAPISKSEKTFTFKEAKEMILAAFGKFNKQFADVAELFFTKNWIHAPVSMGKRGGAFCAYITPDTHPVVLVNFQGKVRDVQTLAHELGHGVNGYLMRGQTPLNFDTPLTLAETASVFGEMLIFDDLKEKITDPKEKFALYVDKIQGIFATVFRQTSMYKFEQDVHKLQKQKGELTVEEINTLWIKRGNEMFVNSVDLSGSEQWWSYIPHFLHTPFYVYGYSFGELLVLSLYAQYKQNPETFVPKYLEMMKTGNSKTPQEILKPFGIDLSDRNFWVGGINIIKEMVVEAKLIYKQIKKRK